MKKTLISLLIATMLITPTGVKAQAQQATIINPETGHRVAVDVGTPFPEGYTLEIFYDEDIDVPVDEDMLGYTVVTDYKTSINVPMNISQTYVPVSSLTTRDGHVLTIDDVDKVFLMIEAGRKKEEISLCTTLDSSAVRWTDCTRGLAFYGKSLVSVPDNIKTHSSGSSVIMSNSHYVYDQFVNKDDDQIMSGLKTFTEYPEISGSDNASTSRQLITFGQANALANQGAATSTEDTAGIGRVASTTDQANNVFDVVDPTFLSTKYASSTCASNYAVISESDNKINQCWIDLTEDFTFTGDVNGATKYGGDGLDGVLNVTSGTTSIDAGDENIVTKNYTSINISSGATLDLTNSATSGTMLILKSKGNVTIEGTIDLEGNGADSDVSGFLIVGGDSSEGDNGSQVATAGTGGDIITLQSFYTTSIDSLHTKSIVLSTGSGGGKGGNSSQGSGGGLGGNGGGVLIIECGGTLNFTGSININGATGQNGSAFSTFTGGAGGGGGTAGMILITYNELSTSTGSIVARGGAGGDGASGTQTNGTGPGGGGGGGSLESAGFNGGAGNFEVAGDNGTDSTNTSGAGGGGGGAEGTPGGSGGSQGITKSSHHLIIKNTEF